MSVMRKWRLEMVCGVALSVVMTLLLHFFFGDLAILYLSCSLSGVFLILFFAYELSREQDRYLSWFVLMLCALPAPTSVAVYELGFQGAVPMFLVGFLVVCLIVAAFVIHRFRH